MSPVEYNLSRGSHDGFYTVSEHDARLSKKKLIAERGKVIEYVHWV